MNKNCLYLLTGCAMFLYAGTCVRKAYAVDYPDIEILVEHWYKALYFVKFENLYQQPKLPSLLSENLPGNGKQAPSFKMYFNGKEYLFTTASDLDQLPCNARLKKICKILCSPEFLASALLRSTVNALREGDGVTTVEIKASNPDPFFDKYGRGRLAMTIERDTQFLARFVFAFEEKAEKHVSMQAISFKCTLPSEETEKWLIREYDTMSLPDFPCDDLLRAPKKIAGVWSALPKDPFMIESIPFNVSFEWGKSPCEFEKETSDKLLSCRAKLKSEAFLEGIFGKNVLDFFKYEYSAKIYTPGLWMGYIIKPLYQNQPADKDTDALDIHLWIMSAYKDLDIDEIPEGAPEELEENQCSNIISDLRFILDIGENKVHDAKFFGNLKLNGKVFMENGYYHDPRPIGERGTMVDD